MTTSKSHIFNPDEFFDFASAICRDSGASEGALRSAISRAYYSAFLEARDALFGTDQAQLTGKVRKKITKTFNIKKKDKRTGLGLHETVIFAILDKTNSAVLSSKLDQLRQARIDADYHRDSRCLMDAGKPSWHDYAKETLELTSLLLPSLKKLPRY